jgi:hypothetical protein
MPSLNKIYINRFWIGVPTCVARILFQAFFIYVIRTKLLDLPMLPSTDKNNMKSDETERISFTFYWRPKALTTCKTLRIPFCFIQLTTSNESVNVTEIYRIIWQCFKLSNRSICHEQRMYWSHTRIQSQIHT